MAKRSGTKQADQTTASAQRREEELLAVLIANYTARFMDTAVEIMVSGLASRKSAVVDASMAALIASGPGITEALKCKLAAGEFSDTESRRVRNVLNAVEYLTAPSPEAPQCFLTLLQTAAIHNDSEILDYLFPLSRVMRRKQLCNSFVEAAFEQLPDVFKFRRLLKAAEMTRDQLSSSLIAEIHELLVSTTGVTRSSCEQLLASHNLAASEQGTHPTRSSRQNRAVADLTPEMVTQCFEEYFFEIADPMWRRGFHCCPPEMLAAATQQLGSTTPEFTHQ